MRIIPHELYKVTPNDSLTALRKEFGMYDYYLNTKKTNCAMNFFLALGREYFNYNFFLWVEEMNSRHLYLNSFHQLYALNNNFKNKIITPFILIIECCIQWELKKFSPFNCQKTWYQIAIESLTETKQLPPTLTENKYLEILDWYNSTFMRNNNKGKLKPKQLNMNQVFTFTKEKLNLNS